jgi:hypothetical protein
MNRRERFLYPGGAAAYSYYISLKFFSFEFGRVVAESIVYSALFACESSIPGVYELHYESYRLPLIRADVLMVVLLWIVQMFMMSASRMSTKFC